MLRLVAALALSAAATTAPGTGYSDADSCPPPEKTFGAVVMKLHVSEWLAEVNKHASEDCCKLILGNKSDAPGRAVTTDEAREKADELACPFLETSAKSALNVEEAFLTLASELLRRAPAEPQKKKRLSLAASAKEKGGKCCS